MWCLYWNLEHALHPFLPPKKWSRFSWCWSCWAGRTWPFSALCLVPAALISSWSTGFHELCGVMRRPCWCYTAIWMASSLHQALPKVNWRWNWWKQTKYSCGWSRSHLSAVKLKISCGRLKNLDVTVEEEQQTPNERSPNLGCLWRRLWYVGICWCTLKCRVLELKLKPLICLLTLEISLFKKRSGAGQGKSSVHLMKSRSTALIESHSFYNTFCKPSDMGMTHGRLNLSIVWDDQRW